MKLKRTNLFIIIAPGNAEPCTQRKQYIRQEEIDAQIETAIKKVVIDERLAEDINLLLEKSYKEMQINTKNKYNYLKQEKEKLKIRVNKLLEMYLDGDITKEEWHDKKQSFNNQLNIYEKQLKTINLSDKHFIDEGKNIIKLAKTTFDSYKNQSVDEKRKLLHVIFDKFTIENRTIKFTYRKPFCYFAQCNSQNADNVVDYIKQCIAS